MEGNKVSVEVCEIKTNSASKTEWFRFTWVISNLHSHVESEYLIMYMYLLAEYESHTKMIREKMSTCMTPAWYTAWKLLSLATSSLDGKTRTGIVLLIATDNIYMYTSLLL